MLLRASVGSQAYSLDVILNLLHELDDLIGNVEKPFSSTFSLRGAALSDRIDWV